MSGVPICERLRTCVLGLHNTHDAVEVCPEAADTIEALYEVATKARLNLKHSVGCQSHWYGLEHCDCETKQLTAGIDAALSRARNGGQP